MRIGKYWLSPMVLVMRFYQLLGKIWFIPFGFYALPMKATGRVPHPLKPRGFRDLILNKMMFPDSIMRAVFADKIAARGLAANIIGSQYIIEVYDILDTVESLSEKNYPYPYIVKPNHASGQIARVRNDADRAKMLVEVKKWDANEYSPKTEWAYRGITHKFIIEKLLQNKDNTAPTELYMIYFFGEPVLFYVVKDRETVPHKAFLTPKWEKLDLKYNYPVLHDVPPKPDNFDEILSLGAQLAEGIDFLRVDFFMVDDQIFFGELTNFIAAGQEQFQPFEFEAELLAQYQRLQKEHIDSTRKKYHNKVLNNLCNDQEL